MSIEEQFNAAVKVIRSLPKNGSFQPSPELKLTFYAYFKQATDGPNDTKKPPFYDVVNRYKWEAWKRLGEQSKEEAMSFYVEELKKVIETVSLTEEVSNFLDILGPFYEFLPEEVTSKSSNKSSPAKIANGIQETMDDQVTTNDLECFNTFDSDGDEFSDTVDYSAPQNDKIPVILQNGSVSAQKYLSESRNPALETKETSVVASKLTNGTSGQTVCTSRNLQPVAATNEDSFGFNEQLTLAVFRLQHSLDRVVNRIDALESELCHQSKSRHSERSAPASLAKWLFPEMSGRTTALVIAWPLIVYFAMHYVKQIRKK